jgi:hypothetical protein
VCGAPTSAGAFCRDAQTVVWRNWRNRCASSVVSKSKSIAPGRGRGRDRLLERPHVVVPVRPFGQVGRGELPLLAWLVEASEEAPLLLPLRDAKEELHDLGPVPVQVALERILVAAGQRFRVRGGRIATIAIAFGLFTYALSDMATLPRL